MAGYADQIAKTLMRRSLAPPASYGPKMSKQGYRNPGATYKPVLPIPTQKNSYGMPGVTPPYVPRPTLSQTPQPSVPGVPVGPPASVVPQVKPSLPGIAGNVVPLPSGGFWDVRTQAVVTDPVVLAAAQQAQQPSTPGRVPPGTIPITDGAGNVRYWSPTLQRFVDIAQ